MRHCDEAAKKQSCIELFAVKAQYAKGRIASQGLAMTGLFYFGHILLM